MAARRKKKIARWKDTTSIVTLVVSEEQDKLLLEWLTVGKYAWNWALTESQLQNMRTRSGLRDNWPTEAELIALWKSRKADEYSNLPNSIPELSIAKYMSSCFFSRIGKAAAPPPAGGSLGGSFRVDKHMCSLSEDKTTFHVEGIGDMTMEDYPDTLDWEDVLYVTIRRYVKKGYRLYLVKAPSKAGVQNSVFLDEED